MYILFIIMLSGPIHFYFLPNFSPYFLTTLVLANAVSRVDPHNEIGHPAHSRKRFKQVPVVSTKACVIVKSSGAVRQSRWPSWAVRPNEPHGFRGHKAILNRAHALVSACP